MPRISERTIAYLAFGGFCLLSSTRDVLSEILFKGKSFEADPVFVLFVYSVVAQIIAAGYFFTETSLEAARQLPFKKIWKELLWLNVFTLTAWYFYYLAIDTPLGAALTSLVEYGSGPIFTVIIGTMLAREHIDKFFVWSAIASIIGIIILATPRWHTDSVSMFWFLGLALAVLTSLSSACYRIYFKILLQVGLAKSAIVFLRLVGTTFSLGIYLIIRPDLFRVDLLFATAIIGVVGFAIPLFLVLTVLQRVTIPRYAMLLFCVPAITFIFSSILGYGNFYLTDLLAAGVIVFGIAVHEAFTRPRRQMR